MPPEKQQRARASYDRLVAAAGEWLDEMGFEGVSTTAIAGRPGVTPPALYRDYEDKYALMREFGLYVMQAQNARLAEFGENLESDPEKVLTRGILTRLLLETVAITE